MALNQNWHTLKNSSFLTIWSINIVLISHVIFHVTILLNIVNYWPVGGRFKKRNEAITIFWIHVNYFQHFTLGMTVHCTSRKNYEGKHHFKCPANLILTLIWNFAYIHSKSRLLGMFNSFRNANSLNQTK